MAAPLGILDLQGGVHEHLDHLQRLGVETVRVKKAEDLSGLCGLIIPGGESTCLSRLLKIFDMEKPILAAFQSGMKIWGTCAGAILVASDIVGEIPHLGLVDISIQRNAFGSQLDSFHCLATIPEACQEAIPLTFIRAPQITRVGENVKVLLEMDSYVAAAETDDVLVTVFHPELTPSLAFHRYFARKCGLQPAKISETSAYEHDWDRVSWMRHARVVS